MITFLRAVSRGGIALSLATLLAIPFGVGATGSTTEVETELVRLEGTSRAATAARICQEAYSTDHEKKYVILTSRESAADAVVAGPLAAIKDTCVLLTDSDTLDGATRSEIDRLLKKSTETTSVSGQTGTGTSVIAHVIIVGGTSAVKTTIEDQIKDIRDNGEIGTMRVSGATRELTALEVAKDMDSVRGAKPTIVFIAGRDAQADALGAAAVATNHSLTNGYAPILLSEKDALEPEVEQYLKDKAAPETSTMTGTISVGITTAYTLGGQAVISDTLINTLKGIINEVVAIGGFDRYVTNANFMETFYGTSNEPRKIGIARGDVPFDALGFGPFLGKKGAPLALVKPMDLPDSVEAYIVGHKEKIGAGWIAGGDEAVDPTVEAEIEQIYLP
jgi:N-acetylmuramoyl-L-alanine amidase